MRFWNTKPTKPLTEIVHSYNTFCMTKSYEYSDMSKCSKLPYDSLQAFATLLFMREAKNYVVEANIICIHDDFLIYRPVNEISTFILDIETLDLYFIGSSSDLKRIYKEWVASDEFQYAFKWFTVISNLHAISNDKVCRIAAYVYLVAQLVSGYWKAEKSEVECNSSIIESMHLSIVPDVEYSETNTYVVHVYDYKDGVGYKAWSTDSGKFVTYTIQQNKSLSVSEDVREAADLAVLCRYMAEHGICDVSVTLKEMQRLFALGGHKHEFEHIVGIVKNDLS